MQFLEGGAFAPNAPSWIRHCGIYAWFLPLMFTAADPGFIKGGAPVYGVGICAPQKLKLFAEQNILNGLDHTAFYVDYIDQELYRSIKVTIMPADYYYRPKEWHTQDRMYFIYKISLAG